MSAPAERPLMHESKRALWPERIGTKSAAAWLFVIVLGVALPVVRNGFIDYDDNGYVTANGWVQNGLTWANLGRAFRTTEVANWTPLAWISHLTDVTLFGLNPAGHHCTSALLHAFNALLLFLVLRRITGAMGRSWFVAAVFGLHPLHVESFAWVAERKDVLSTLFLLLAVWSYTLWLEARAAARPRAGGFYALSLVAFAAALMSKPMVVTLPCLLLLLDYWPLRRWGRGAGGPAAAGVGWLFAEKIPFFALSAADSVVTVKAQQMLGAVQTVAHYSWPTRVANALLSYAGYLEKCFVPVKLAVFYPYAREQPAGLATAAGVLLAVVTVAVFLWRERRPYLLTGWLWYLGMLVPAIGLVQVGGQAMADRYTYVPLVGISIMIAWGATDLAAGWTRRGLWLASAGAAVLVALSAVTLRQIGYWRTSETLFRHALTVTDGNWLAHFCLGYDYASTHGRDAEAIAEYRTAIALAPMLAQAHFSLGAVLLRDPRRAGEAAAEFEAALRIDPQISQGDLALGKTLKKIPGQLPATIRVLEAAVRLEPDSVETHNELADALAELPDRRPEAAAEYRWALQLRPDSVVIRNSLGIVLAQIPGRLPEAIAEFRAVLRARPDFEAAHVNLANALAQHRAGADEAIAEFEAALRLQPDDYWAEFSLARLLAMLPGREQEAETHLQAVLRTKPDFAPARRMLAELSGHDAR